MSANPAPLGLAGFSITTLLLSIYNTGIVVGFGAPVNIVLGLAIFYGGLAQLIAGIWEYKAGNTFGATVFSSYAAFWLSYAVILIPGFGVLEAFANDPKAVGAAIASFLLCWAIFTFLMFLCTFRQSVALMLLFAMLDITFVLLTIADFKQSSKTTFTKAAGYTGITTGVIGLYMVLATLATKDITFFTLPLGKVNKHILHPSSGEG